MPEEAEKQVRFEAHPLGQRAGLAREACLGGWQWAGLWGRDELTKLWVSGQGLPLSLLHSWVFLQLPHTQAWLLVPGLDLLQTLHLHSTARYGVGAEAQSDR